MYSEPLLGLFFNSIDIKILKLFWVYYRIEQMNKYIDVENPNSHNKDSNTEREAIRIPIG